MGTLVQKITSDIGGETKIKSGRETCREGVWHSICKGPEAGWCLACWRNNEMAGVAGAESVRGREGGGEGRKTGGRLCKACGPWGGL